MKRVSLSLLVAAQALAFIWFAAEFWPRRAASRIASSSSEIDEHAHFDRLVFVLIDALRGDFVGSMPFTSSLVERGRAISFDATASPPTVTLPRIRSILTGASGSSMLDAVTNIVESEGDLLGDNWLARLAVGRSVAFAGDDTWLRLFPRGFFDFQDGVSSFVVSDTVIVDANVTRHLAKVRQFDVNIFHYLGLDHAGHVGGASGPLIAPKLIELDGVVDRLYGSLGKRDLLVVLGDHGMTASGNHGGGSAPERSTGQIWASPSFNAPSTEQHRSQQVDLVPTICLAFGLGWPRRSVGIPLLPVLEAAGIDTQAALAKTAAHFDTLDPTGLSGDNRYSLRRRQSDQLSAFDIVPLRRLVGPLISLSMTPIILATRSRPSQSFLAVIIAHSALMASSSFIEEEHELAFTAASTVAALGLASDMRTRELPIRSVISLVCIRLMRSWSLNGQKLVADAAIARHWLLAHPAVTWLAALGALAQLGSARVARLPLLAAVLAWLLTREGSTIAHWPFDRVDSARLVYAAAAAHAAATGEVRWAIKMVLVSLTRLDNIPLFALVDGALLGAEPSSSRPMELAVQLCAFFAAGGSNSLAAVDLTQSYNGLRTYSGWTAVLTFASNYALVLYSISRSSRDGLAHRALFHSTALFVLALSATIQRGHLFTLTVFQPAVLYKAVWALVILPCEIVDAMYKR